MATAKRARTKKTTEPKSESKPVAATTSAVTTVTTRSVDLQDAIRERAYEIYEQRGGQHGADMEDWIRAEREIIERFRGRTA
ncbi:MAG TPA: DUF2934 domain-containing protein [Terriglobales bacterium]|nr:DUF2934 domain-containing protein [Terriglobales bacterium]